MLPVTGLKILGRVGTQFFLYYFFFLQKNIILCILKDMIPFKMHEIIFFPEKLKIILGVTRNIGRMGLP